jgi:hypothetical protein
MAVAPAPTAPHPVRIPQPATAQTVVPGGEAPAIPTTVRFDSWGPGHEVTVAFATQAVVLTPSTDRVGHALQAALHGVDGDQGLPALRVMATDADGRRSQHHGRGDSGEDT